MAELRVGSCVILPSSRILGEVTKISLSEGYIWIRWMNVSYAGEPEAVMYKRVYVEGLELVCRNCKRMREYHSNQGRCLFDTTYWED